MKNKITGFLIAVGVILVLLVSTGAFFTVNETEQVIITQFGKPVGDPINPPTAPESEAGLKFKVPFLWKVNRFPKLILEWDGQSAEMPTSEKTYIQVDTYGRWRISDPLAYFEKLREERRAQSRLDGILGSETRNTIARYQLVEVVRSDKEREPQQLEAILEADMGETVGQLKPIDYGRSALEQEILEKSAKKLEELGIELLDVRFKRINYNEDVRERIYERMISERQQIAERFRSEGAGEAAKVLGNMERELKEIESTAYKQIEMVKGDADAKATSIYAEAYNQSQESAEFYEFTKTMEVYREILSGDSTIVLSTDSELFHYLKRIDPALPGAGDARKGPDSPAEE